MKNSKVDTPGVKNQKIMTKPSKERSIQDARLAALEKRNEQLQKSLEESLAQIKENEKKRKKDESEASANAKALKKAVEAAEKDKEKLLLQLKEEQEKGLAASTAIPRASTDHVPQPVLPAPLVPPLYSNVGGGQLQNISQFLPHMMSTVASGQQYKMSTDQQPVASYSMNMQQPHPSPPPPAQGKQSVPITDMMFLYMMMNSR